MTERLQILKHLFDEHFTHEDWLLKELTKLSKKETKELTKHMLSHPHAQKLRLISNKSLEEMKKGVPKKPRVIH